MRPPQPPPQTSPPLGVPGNAALVLPVPPPADFSSHLHHVDTEALRRDRQGQCERTDEAEARHRSGSEPRHSRTLPAIIRRLRARSREGISLPPDRDVHVAHHEVAVSVVGEERQQEARANDHASGLRVAEL